MSFFCPHQDGTQEVCYRLGGLKCRPGLPGCALFGKVTRLEDVPPPPPRKPRKPKDGSPDER